MIKIMFSPCLSIDITLIIIILKVIGAFTLIVIIAIKIDLILFMINIKRVILIDKNF